MNMHTNLLMCQCLVFFFMLRLYSAPRVPTVTSCTLAAGASPI